MILKIEIWVLLVYPDSLKIFLPATPLSRPYLPFWILKIPHFRTLYIDANGRATFDRPKIFFFSNWSNIVKTLGSTPRILKNPFLSRIYDFLSKFTPFFAIFSLFQVLSKWPRRLWSPKNFFLKNTFFGHNCTRKYSSFVQNMISFDFSAFPVKSFVQKLSKNHQILYIFWQKNFKCDITTWKTDKMKNYCQKWKVWKK